MHRRPILIAALAALVLAFTGCGGAKNTATGSVPASAAQAPADAIAYVSVNTDLSSEQWKNAQALIDLFPTVKASVTKEIEDELAEQKLDWKTDVEPALGRELVVVVSAASKPVVLLQPEDPAKLEHLLTLSDGDERPVQGTVGDWTALAETKADLDAYTSALDRGTLASVDSFTDAMGDLPAETLVKAWVDGTGLTENVKKAASEADGLGVTIPGVAGGEFPAVDLDSIALALSAKENGVHVVVDTKGAKLGDGTSYEPKLFAKVPGDAVAALSFGGTQGLVDRLSGPLEKVSGPVESAIGVDLDKVLEAFSGEGVVYVRRGSGSVPEVTAVLAPPHVDDTLQTIDTIVHKLAEQSGATVEQTTLDDVAVSRLDLQGVPLTYGKLDDDTIIITIGSDAISAFNGASERLVDTDGFTKAAEAVGLGDRTSGFLYVDFDGLVPLVTGIAGADRVPADASAILEKLDSVIFETDASGDGMQITGFVGVHR